MILEKLIKSNLDLYLSKLEKTIERKDNEKILKLMKQNYNQSKKFYYYNSGDQLSKEDYKEMSLLAHDQLTMGLYEDNPLGWDNTVMVNITFNDIKCKCVVSLHTMVCNNPNNEFCILSFITPPRTKERKMEVNKRRKERKILNNI